VTIIEKIKERISELKNDKSFNYKMGAIDCLEIVISELEKEEYRKKCENCKYKNNCLQYVSKILPGKFTYCSNFIDKDIK